MSQHATGTYVKDDRRRVATTPAEAVAAVFDGFKLAAEADLPRPKLQELAKAAGIPANLSNEAIKAKLSEVDSDGQAVENDNPDAPETGNDSLVTGPSNS